MGLRISIFVQKKTIHFCILIQKFKKLSHTRGDYYRSWIRGAVCIQRRKVLKCRKYLKSLSVIFSAILKKGSDVMLYNVWFTSRQQPCLAIHCVGGRVRRKQHGSAWVRSQSRRAHTTAGSAWVSMHVPALEAGCVANSSKSRLQIASCRNFG